MNLDQIHSSTVLLRVSFDIPNFDDVSRIKDALPTIQRLLEQKNQIIIVTKWGKVKEIPEIDKMHENKLSTRKLLRVFVDELWKSLPKNLLENIQNENQETKKNEENQPKPVAVYVNQFACGDFEELKNQIQSQYFDGGRSQIILLENTHFDKREKSKNASERLEIASKYAGLADNFVDEAFASSHRMEATNSEIKTLLPNSLGISYQNEVQNLEKLKINPQKPLVVIMGGAKLETKLPLLERLLPIADKILVAGVLVFTFIKAAKLNQKANQIEKENNSQNSQNSQKNSENPNSTINSTNSDLENGQISEQILPEIFDSTVEEDFVPIARELLKKYSDKIVLPVDFVYEKNEKGKFAYDIGNSTIELFGKNINEAKTLFWNGPMGFFEKKPFDKGTFEVAKIITQNKNCYSVLGGGDTNSALGKDILNQFGFVSMAGGATLDFLSK